jgi:hypothetical protein
LNITPWYNYRFPSACRQRADQARTDHSYGLAEARYAVSSLPW